MPDSSWPMVSVPDALATVLAQAVPLPPVALPLDAALGCVLAEDVAAPEPLPPFRASIKDGYAVHAADGPGDYPVVGEATAGHIAAFVLPRGAVAYITTGAPLPEGADAVVMVEQSELLPARNGQPYVRLHGTVHPGADVRPVGYDIAAGETVLSAGTRLGPAEIGLLATVGYAAAPVHRRPRVAVLSTGDELVDPGLPLGPGQIRDSNRATLIAAVRSLGGDVIDLGIAPDDQAELDRRISAGLAEADMLLTSGGVSMGNLDYIKPLLEQAGQVHFGRMRMKPGKPVTFATVDRGDQRTGGPRLVFGLPGNPVSSLVTFYLLAAPALRKLAGLAQPELRRIQAVLAEPLALDRERPEYHRARVTWQPDTRSWLAHSTGNQASSRLASLRSANALLELPQADGTLPAGSVVDALWIGDW